MMRSVLIGISLILAAVFVVTTFLQWRYANIIQDDVDYMSERIVNAPDEMPWPRSDSPFPYGIHEELGLHSKIMSIFTALNQSCAAVLVVILFSVLWRHPRVRNPIGQQQRVWRR